MTIEAAGVLSVVGNAGAPAYLSSFFCQAEDGIRDLYVTGVQTCALPISSGGSPVEMTRPDTTRFETSHRWPMFLPDGKHLLYLAANFSGQLEKNAIFLGSLDSQEKHLLVSSSANAAYAEPGFLLYLRDKTLVAQPFDGRRYLLSGEH